MEQLFSPAYDNLETQVICHLTSFDSPLYGKNYKYLKDNILPLDLSQNQKINFILQSSRYTLITDTLYWHGLDGTPLWCIEYDESKKSWQEVHGGIFGTHSSGLTLANKLVRMRYYWPTKERESFTFVKKCSKCQICGNIIHAPT